MQKSIYYISTLIILILLSSCRKDSFNDVYDIDRPEIEQFTFVEAQVQGVVIDTKNQPISDALVEWGGTSSFTDSNGAFSLSGLVKNKNAALEISKIGYFDGIKVIQTFPGEVSEIKVSLAERTLSGTINSQTGGMIEANEGGKIEFADGFQHADGTAYQGEVEVYAFYIHPELEYFEQLLPGNQMAINTENVRQVLESYGMINVELQDAQGNELQISKPATITSPISQSLRASAPITIPLWHFDIENKYWKEEGTATLVDGNYVGQVNHFTWWNCDVPRDFVYLEGSIAPIRGEEWDHTIRLTNLSSGTIATTNVSQQGSFAGFIPKDEYLKLEILNLCSDVIYSTETGSFDADVVLPEIVISTNEMNWFKVSGELVDCNNNPVSNGYVSLQYDGFSEILFVDDQGRFSEILPICNFDELVFTAVDINNLKNTVAEKISFDSDIKLNQIRVCEDIGGEFSMTIDGEMIVEQPCYVDVFEILLEYMILFTL